MSARIVRNSTRLIKDSTWDSAVVSRNLKLPEDDPTILTPHIRGSFLYGTADDILYYADGNQWIPLLSGTGNNLIPGFGISITSSGGNITITNTSPASSITLVSLGGTFPLVPAPETGPNLSIKGFNAGTGISISDSGLALTITNTTTLSSLDPGGVGNLVPGGPQTGNFTIKGIAAADSSITVTSNGTDVLLSVPSPTPSLVRVAQSFGPTNSPGGFVVPANAIGPRMWACGGGGGGAGGNELGVGGPGGCGGASTMQILEPGDIIQWSFIGSGGSGSSGGSAPAAAGNGGNTRVGVNGSPQADLYGGQGGLNVLLNGSIYCKSNFDLFAGGFVANTTPVYPPTFPAAAAAFPSYLMGYHGGYPNAAGGASLSNGTHGEGIILRAGGGFAGASTGGAGGGGGGGGSLKQGGNGGTGANGTTAVPINPSTPGGNGIQGSGGGGGGGGGSGPLFLPPAGGGNGGDGIVLVEYWIFTP